MNNKDITKVISQKRALNSSSFLLKFAENEHNLKRNMAFLVSKKIFKTAVSRNKAKRKIRSVIYKIMKKPEFTDLKNKLLVFTIFDTITNKSTSETEKEIINIFKKII